MNIQYKCYKKKGIVEKMAIIVNLDVMLAKRKMSLNDLAARVGITIANLSILKNNKARAIRFSTLDALCKALDCQPKDLLEYEETNEPKSKEEIL